jgi:saccharopine dehydrogenase-like NADP-dependent oxidoreductase
MKKVVVLGAGLVGGPIALDLARDFEVVVADISPDALRKLENVSGIKTVVADLSDPENISRLLKDADYAVNAVPGFLGFKALETAILAGVDVVDIAFMPEDVMALDQFAKEKQVCVISDMGVAPGMSNLLAGYAGHLLDRYDKLEIYVGGLPKVRTWPWEYKAVFSPTDVLEEYTRPARLVRNGKIVIMPALSEPELLEMPVVGTLEAFNSDGLRSLVHTLDVPEMVEKTMRYKGHAELMRVLSHAGFFNTEEIKVGSQKIRPLDFTSKLLFKQWKLDDGEEDLTVMKIIAQGEIAGKKTIIEWELYDEFNQQTGVHSMARTTGYAATAALRMMSAGLYNHHGVHVPEFIGRYPDCVDFMLNEQAKRGVVYKEMRSQR